MALREERGASKAEEGQVGRGPVSAVLPVYDHMTPNFMERHQFRNA